MSFLVLLVMVRIIGFKTLLDAVALMVVVGCVNGYSPAHLRAFYRLRALVWLNDKLLRNV